MKKCPNRHCRAEILADDIKCLCCGITIVRNTQEAEEKGVQSCTCVTESGFCKKPFKFSIPIHAKPTLASHYDYYCEEHFDAHQAKNDPYRKMLDEHTLELDSRLIRKIGENAFKQLTNYQKFQMIVGSTSIGNAISRINKYEK